MRELTDIRLKVLLVSRRKEVLDALQTLLQRRAGLTIARKQVVNGHVDPLHEVTDMPDAMVLHLGETWRAELEALAATPADRRPPLIVIGSAPDATAMRLAMQAGARDLLPLPLVETDLFAALERIGRDQRALAPAASAAVTVFINAKGGCGGTFLACNVADALTARLHKRALLLDLDLQFGTIPLYFDLFPARGLLQALENHDQLDEAALEGYLHRHGKLAILGHATQDKLPLEGISVGAVDTLLKLCARSYEHILIDLPRQLDPLACRVIEQAEQVVLVVQQSVTVLRDAAKVMTCLQRDLLVDPGRILTVVNRHDRRSSISLEHVRSALACSEPMLVPNDYRTVEDSVATGQPLLAQARGAAVTKAVGALAERLGGARNTVRRSLLSRTLSKVIKPRAP